MIMHGDIATSAGHPLTLGVFLPETGIEGTVSLTTASQGSEMVMGTMRPTQAKVMLMGETKIEEKAGAKYLKVTSQIDKMLGGSPDKIMSSTGSEVASNEEEKKT